MNKYPISAHRNYKSEAANVACMLLVSAILDLMLVALCFI